MPKRIRDAVLQISGKLDLTMGGPSVKQFVESPGIHVTPNVDYQSFDVDAPGNFRRSIYRFLFRTLPDPLMESLDCPDGSQMAPVRSAIGDGAAGADDARQSLHRPAERAHRRAADASGAAICPSRCGCCFKLALLRDPTPAESGRWQALCRAARTGQRLPDDVQHQRIHVCGLAMTAIATRIRRPVDSSRCRVSRDASCCAAGQPASAACRCRTCWARRAAGRDRCGSRASRGRLERRLAPPGQSQTRGAVVHERRRQPDGHVRLQAPAGRAHGQKFDPGGDVKLESVTGSPGFKVLQEPVRVQAARPVRPLGEQRLSAPGRLRRRPGLSDVDGVEDQRPRAGQLHAKHRLRPAGLSLHGRLAQLWPGQLDATTCRRSS